uniref:Uncharacterized protein n=1 Tax=Rhizophora mucronata TaxID=61149 RepID=A0A2P2J634_RHIMU
MMISMRKSLCALPKMLFSKFMLQFQMRLHLPMALRREGKTRRNAKFLSHPANLQM